ncbi:hypothetical protein BACCAP_00832 [Pseudoflavonifractor capillosus ATCC 29799]|uniref:Uncharacterized protein n=1 Tax=Pseudoflavonifractor capillosus ATCC 29799 TaxID=411467 RepID=A6NRK4_9FIRM|nr:hypothetical protein BACCAP_00832 [Pseudoflavonifractor capillosus ATCC 29799]
MKKSKLIQTNERNAEHVVQGYKKIEDGVVGGYKRVEQGAVDGFQKVSDAFVERFSPGRERPWRRPKPGWPENRTGEKRGRRSRRPRFPPQGKAGQLKTSLPEAAAENKTLTFAWYHTPEHRTWEGYSCLKSWWWRTTRRSTGACAPFSTATAMKPWGVWAPLRPMMPCMRRYLT